MIGKTSGILAAAGLGLSLAAPLAAAQWASGEGGLRGHWSTRTLSETDRGDRDRGQGAGQGSAVETSPSPSPRSRFSRQGGADDDRPGAEESRGIFRDDERDWNRNSARQQFEEDDVSQEGSDRGGDIDRSDYRSSRDRHRPGSNWTR